MLKLTLSYPYALPLCLPVPEGHTLPLHLILYPYARTFLPSVVHLLTPSLPLWGTGYANKGDHLLLYPYPSPSETEGKITRTPKGGKEGGKEGGTGKQRSTGASYLRFPKAKGMKRFPSVTYLTAEAKLKLRKPKGIGGDLTFVYPFIYPFRVRTPVTTPLG